MSTEAAAGVLQDSFASALTATEPVDVLRLVGQRAVGQAASAPTVVTAVFCGFDQDDMPLVRDLPGLNREIVPAQTVVALLSDQVGCRVVVMFEGDDVRKPIVMGVLQQPQRRAVTAEPTQSPAQSVSVQADDQRLVLSAEREVVLRCGDASITLTRAGKVLIQGKYVLSRSSGYNKVKGAAVDIN